MIIPCVTLEAFSVKTGCTKVQAVWYGMEILMVSGDEL